jgi:hypothetical protein
MVAKKARRDISDEASSVAGAQHFIWPKAVKSLNSTAGGAARFSHLSGHSLVRPVTISATRPQDFP